METGGETLLEPARELPVVGTYDVVQEGVKLLHDTRVCAVRRGGYRVSHLIVENKTARTALGCRSVVDATGDADLCFLAGEPTESLDTNVLSGWFCYLMESGLHQDTLSSAYSSRAEKQGAVGPFFRGDDAEGVTAQILAAHPGLPAHDPAPGRRLLTRRAPCAQVVR